MTPAGREGALSFLRDVTSGQNKHGRRSGSGSPCCFRPCRIASVPEGARRSLCFAFGFGFAFGSAFGSASSRLVSDAFCHNNKHTR